MIWKEAEYMHADDVETVANAAGGQPANVICSERMRERVQTLVSATGEMLPTMVGLKNQDNASGLAIDWIGPEQLKALDERE